MTVLRGILAGFALLLLELPGGAEEPLMFKDARALVQKWLAAQNAGDFETYASFYSERFRGVRRSRDRTIEFDREGWLKDRRRMFKKSMKVTAENVAVVRREGEGVEVQLTQSFRQGSYADVGQKQLALVREGMWLRIVSEEMLESQREPSPPPGETRAR